MTRRAALIALPLTLAACSDSLGPDMGRARIFLGVDGGPSASIAAAIVSASAAPVSFGQVASLELVVDRIEAHREDGGWESLDIEPVTIDLAGIEAGTVEPLAAGGLPEGTYDNLRLFLQSATISFSEDVSTGNHVFTAGELYDLVIPSAQNTGLKIPTAHFVVEAAAEGATESVVVLFDANGSTASIGTTGSGKVRMRPVLREADEAAEAAAESGEGG